jgi:murein L,D-transpeptidase YcbB/YkuD
MLDRALIAYASALRRAPTREWIINDRDAIPTSRPAAELLAEAARSPSLEAWVDAMPFMHPSYAGLRRALAGAVGRGDRSQDVLRVNLLRARFLPAGGHYVMVNTAAQRLYMYENGEVVDEMRVVVGKPKNPTPMMAATIKFTALNPYWNVPADLTAERIAPNVLKDGVGYLRTHGYVVFSDWGDRANPIDPSTIDWEAVEAGRVQIRVRQNPGPGNAMGRMKFMFPNPQGIYLHDTPDKQLLNEAARLFSGGCVRLEDAPRLAKWLYGKPLSWKGAKTEQPVELPKPVALYLIYQTAVPSDGRIVFYEDIYGSDRSMLAGSSEGRIAAR